MRSKELFFPKEMSKKKRRNNPSIKGIFIKYNNKMSLVREYKYHVPTEVHFHDIHDVSLSMFKNQM